MEQKEMQAEIMLAYKKELSMRKIAEETGVSLGAVCKILKKIEECKATPWVRVLYYMDKDELCTVLYVDFKNESIQIENYTDNLLKRAFGVVEYPKWEDFQDFLEERCFPRTRDHMKLILKDLELSSYDPVAIVEKTQGRMAEDNQWIWM